MAITRINNNQISDAVTGNVYLGVNAGVKLQDYSLTSAKIANDLTYNSNFTVTGNLTVQGNTTTIDTVNLVVEDPLILLAKEQTGSPTLDIGYIGKRGTDTNIAFVWDESADQFVAVFTTSETTNTVITIDSYAALQVANLTASNANISGSVALGNVTIGNVVGNLTVTGNTNSGNFLTAGLVSATGNVTGGNINTGGIVNATGNLVSGANLVVAGYAAVTGNIDGGNLRTAGLVTATGNVTGGNVNTAGVVTATGNVTGGNVNTAGIVSATGNILTGANLVATSNVIGGNISTAGVVTATGNVTGGNINTAGIVSATGNLVSGANLVVAGYATVTGNIDGGNIRTAGQVTATGNVTGGNLITSGALQSASLSVTGNVDAGNLRTTGLVTATGNVTGGNINTGGIVSATGNLVSGANLVVAGYATVTGNIDGGNIRTAGQVTATGNISGGNANIAGLTVTNTLETIGNALIGGNLVVQGNITYINIDDLRVEDPIIILGTGPNGAPLSTDDGMDRGIYMEYYKTGLGNAWMGWDNSTGNLVAAANVNFSGNNVVNVLTYGTFQAGNAYFESMVSGGNANVGNLGTAGLITATGNITGGNLITAGVTSTATLSVSGNANVGNLGTAGQVTATGNVTGGNVNTAGVVTATGNVTGGNINTGGIVSATGNILTGANLVATSNVIGGNISTAGVVTATGNVTGGNINTGGIVNATGNLVSGANLVVAGYATVTGNINGGNINTGGIVSATGNILTGANLVATSNVIGGNISTAGVVTATGNVTGGNINTGGIVSATGNLVSGANLVVSGYATVTGNIDGGNLRTTGQVTATGNVTGGNIIGVTSGRFGNIVISGDDITDTNGRVNINTAGEDVDFAVNGDTVANILYVDAGTGTVGFGSSATLVNAIASFNTSTSILMPVGNTAQRPDPATLGMLRFNSTGDALEVYATTGWETVGVPSFTVITDDQFAGNGVQTQYTLSIDSTSAASIVSINGVVQIPTTAYSITGNVLTFTEAPGVTDVIDVRSLTTTTTVIGIENTPGTAAIIVNDSGGDVFVTGNLIPTANVTYNLGSTTARWKDGFFSGTSITFGNIVMKNTGGNTVGFFGPDGTTPATLDANVSIVGDAIENGTSNVSFAGLNGNVLLVAGGTTTGVITSTGANIAGYTTVTGNITGGNLITAGQVVATGNVNGGNLVATTAVSTTSIIKTGSNAVGNIGSASNYFNTVFAQATSALYADLAEMYESNQPIEPGTVVCFGGPKEVKLCDEDACRRVAGVISTNPSYVMNAGLNGEYVVAVALTGRVPTKVTGTIRKGDMLVATGDGRARAEENPSVGAVIGKALADFDGNDGVIEVVVGRL